MRKIKYLSKAIREDNYCLANYDEADTIRHVVLQLSQYHNITLKAANKLFLNALMSSDVYEILVSKSQQYIYDLQLEYNGINHLTAVERKNFINKN